MITISPGMREQVIRQAIRESPNEACGLIGGTLEDDGARAASVFEMRNADGSPVTYRLDAQEQLSVFGEIERLGLDLVAIYHSHTHSPAYPSETDRRQAFYPDAHYLLVSLQDPERPELRAFRIVDGEVSEETLRVEAEVAR